MVSDVTLAGLSCSIRANAGPGRLEVTLHPILAEVELQSGAALDLFGGLRLAAWEIARQRGEQWDNAALAALFLDSVRRQLSQAVIEFPEPWEDSPD